MKQKLLSVAVASALGLGAADYGQTAEGVKAYARLIVTDFRAEIEGQIVEGAGSVVSGSASTAAITSNGNFPAKFPPRFVAEPGAASKAIGIFGADQVCIESLGQNDISPPCPVEAPEGDSTEAEKGSSYPQVGDLPDDVLDVSQGDNRNVPSPGPADGVDDVYAVAQCQRSPEGAISQSGEGGSATSVKGFKVPVESPLLELVGNSDVFVEARHTGTDALEESTAAIATTSVDFTITNRAGETVSCDASDLRLRAVATLENPESEDSFASLPDAPARLPCAADGSTGGTGFAGGVWDPDDTYRVFAGLGADAACLLRGAEAGDGFKWYSAKNNRSPRLPRPIVTDLVINDQFGTQIVNVRKLIGLMNPARKNEVGPPRFEDHLSCYLLRRTSPDPVAPGRVRITTENFWKEDVRLRRRPVLCGPAIKNGEGSLDGTYYQCYRAAGGQPQRDTTVSDQFFDQKPHALTGMSRVCTPVSFGAGNQVPPDTDPHLACYEFPQGSQALNQRIRVKVLDPFMVDAGFGAPGVPVTVKREERFCETATKKRR